MLRSAAYHLAILLVLHLQCTIAATAADEPAPSSSFDAPRRVGATANVNGAGPSRASRWTDATSSNAPLSGVHRPKILKELTNPWTSLAHPRLQHVIDSLAVIHVSATGTMPAAGSDSTFDDPCAYVSAFQTCGTHQDLATGVSHGLFCSPVSGLCAGVGAVCGESLACAGDLECDTQRHRCVEARDLVDPDERIVTDRTPASLAPRRKNTVPVRVRVLLTGRQAP